MKDHIILRRVCDEDVDMLLDVYRPYVLETAITFEYEVPTRDEFLQRIRDISAKYPYIVAELNGKVIGYAYANAFHVRAAYAWAAEAAIYVDREYKHGGIGRLLYSKLEELLIKMHVLNLNVCISIPKKADPYLNDNSQKFHEHMGYTLVGRFHKVGYKFSTWYDMIWMEKMLGEHPDRPEPIVDFGRISL